MAVLVSAAPAATATASVTAVAASNDEATCFRGFEASVRCAFRLVEIRDDLRSDGRTDLRGTAKYARIAAEYQRLTGGSIGDVNGDGRVTALDASIALDIAKGRRDTRFPLQYLAVDYNLSGYVTEADAYLLSLKAVGLVG
ncbi:MAG: dockerin type I repeat-containing protein [Phycicoccus sp.]